MPPRSATKSQADKKGRKSSAQVATPQPQDADEEDTISGRFTRSQWSDILSQEDSDEIVGEITQELMTKVMRGTLNAYIEKQVKEKDYFFYLLSNHHHYLENWHLEWGYCTFKWQYNVSF